MRNKRIRIWSDVKNIAHSNTEILIVYYSYATVPELEDDMSPMITTIVVKSLDGTICECYGLYLEADLIGVSRSEMKNIYPDLELSLLEKFMAFVRLHNSSYWLSWDMKDITFGFQALKHRYSKLTGGCNTGYFEIPINKRRNLDVIFSEMYGEHYSTESDRLLDVMKYNGCNTQSYLNNNSESYEFNKCNYNSVLESVRIKVDSITILFNKLVSRKIKIPHMNKYSIFIEVVTHPIMAFIGWVATIIGLIVGIIALC